MRLLAAVLLSLPLLAQDASTQKAQPADTEPRVSIELGNRWSTDLRGNENVYRSMVNLGDGPKVLGLDVSLKPAKGLFDTFELRGYGWGGEPYSTARFGIERKRLYRFTGDYRNIAYFNDLPSFANPRIGSGILNSQDTFNIRRRMLDTQLDLFPDRWFVPYLAYSRDWGSGNGVTDFVSDSNEWSVRNLLQDKTDNYRGGVRLQFRRFHATLEQGGTAFKDDQRVYLPPSAHYGDRTTKFLGQYITLSNLNQAYRVRGDSKYSEALVTANPFSWLNLSGQFLYSMPSSKLTLTQNDTGNLFSFDSFSFFTAENLLATSEAKHPHTSGTFGAEVRLHRRLRVLESVTTDRFHTSSNLLALTDTLTPGGATSQGLTGLEPLVLNYSKQEFNVLFDATSRLTLRGGHRLVWGDAETRASNLSQTGPQRTGESRMQVGLAGLTFRPASKLSVYFDFEDGSADRIYFRTSLQDYKRMQTRARYQALNSLMFSANFSWIDNNNPDPASKYNFENRNNSLTAYWTPKGGKWVSLTADYTRSTLHSDISYLMPQNLQPARSFYEERAHVGTAVLDLKLPKVGAGSPKLSMGGSLFVSRGSRSTEFYQPLGEVTIPLHRRASLFGEWRWYGLGESLYPVEAFRVHHFVLGVRLGL